MTLDDDGRGVALTGATVEADTNYALHLEGLTDRTGNAMWVLDRALSVTDPGVYATLEDTAPPAVLAVLAVADGVYVLLDEPVVAVDGVEIVDVITVELDGTTVVEGVTERLGAKLLKWTADGSGPWYLQRDYEITEILVEDLGTTPSVVGVLSGGFTHLAEHDGQALVAYSKPDHSVPLARSRFGVTSLFQGRGWHEELGVYYYRARWYSPRGASFLERDPKGYLGQASRYLPFNYGHPNLGDPFGREPVPPDTVDEDHQEWMEDYEERISERLNNEENEASIGMRFLSQRVSWATSQTFPTRALKAYARLRYGLSADRRQSFGFIREFSAALPFQGIVVGDNLQFFERPNGRFAVGIFGYETPSNWKDWHDGSRSKGSKVTDGGPMGVIGVGISAVYGISYGISKHPRDNHERTSGLVVDSWTGVSRNFTVDLPFFASGSFFESRHWVGVSAAIGPGTIGFTKSRERSHMIVGPLVVSSEIEAATLFVLYKSNYHWNSALTRYFGSKLYLQTEDPWFGDPEVDVVY